VDLLGVLFVGFDERPDRDHRVEEAGALHPDLLDPAEHAVAELVDREGEKEGEPDGKRGGNVLVDAGE